MNLWEILVRPVLPMEEQRYQKLMQEHHYLGSLPKISETLWYIAAWRDVICVRRCLPPRNPQSSAYYRCVEDHLETFIQVYEDRFERQYGFWRPTSRRSLPLTWNAATCTRDLPG